MNFSFEYLLPLLPVLARAAIIWRFSAVRNDILREPEHDREAYRAYIIAFAGFGFAALFALAIVESSLKVGLHSAIFFLSVSFFAYMLSLDLVAYKGKRWEDQVATALIEVGSLSMFLAVIAVLRATRTELVPLIAAIATIAWGIGHVWRIILDWRYLTKLNVTKTGAQNGPKE